MPFLTKPSQFILAWDRHQICWIAYPVAWLKCPFIKMKMYQHLIYAACKWSIVILSDRHKSGTYMWVDVSAACSCTCSCSVHELVTLMIFCASDNRGCFTDDCTSPVFLTAGLVRVYGVRCTAAFNFYILSVRNKLYTLYEKETAIKTSTLQELHCVSKKIYHATTNDNLNSSCPIPVIFGTNISCLQCFDAVGWAAGRASGL